MYQALFSNFNTSYSLALYWRFQTCCLRHEQRFFFDMKCFFFRKASGFSWICYTKKTAIHLINIRPFHSFLCLPQINVDRAEKKPSITTLCTDAETLSMKNITYWRKKRKNAPDMKRTDELWCKKTIKWILISKCSLVMLFGGALWPCSIFTNARDGKSINESIKLRHLWIFWCHRYEMGNVCMC